MYLFSLNYIVSHWNYFVKIKRICEQHYSPLHFETIVKKIHIPFFPDMHFCA